MRAPNSKNATRTLHKAQESSLTPVSSSALNLCNVAHRVLKTSQSALLTSLAADRTHVWHDNLLTKAWGS